MWRRLHNEELFGFYSSSDCIRLIKTLRIIWAGYVALMVDRTIACRVLVIITYCKASIGSLSHKYENVIELYHRDVERTDMKWIDFNPCRDKRRRF